MTVVTLTDLVKTLNEHLKPHKISDYCPNGLQVEGAQSVTKVVTGVTASQALIEEAINLKADAILVHHGYFWKGEPAPITGIKKRRLKALLDHDISLIAYHLPLDVHLELGNNVQLAKQLGLEPEPVEKKYPLPLIRTATFSTDYSGDAFKSLVHQKLAREPLHIPSSKPIRRLAWCTGGAQSYFEEAINMGVDAFLTGEVSEQTFHLAREYDVHFFAAGHHATERYGIKALGEFLHADLGVEVQFIDCDNPI